MLEIRKLKYVLKGVVKHEKKTSQEHQKVYQERKGKNPPGGFGFGRTRKINFGII